jgi:hypothetical protein
MKTLPTPAAEEELVITLTFCITTFALKIYLFYLKRFLVLLGPADLPAEHCPP